MKEIKKRKKKMEVEMLNVIIAFLIVTGALFWFIIAFLLYILAAMGKVTAGAKGTAAITATLIVSLLAYVVVTATLG